MKLYVSHRAPNPRRVLFFAQEKGLLDQIEQEEVDIFAGEHHAEAYSAVSPLAFVPALVLDDGRTLTESRAICLYFEALQPDPPLFGATPEERAFVEMWDRRMEMMVFIPAAMAVRHGHPAFQALETQLPDYAEASRRKLIIMLDWLNDHLADSPYIAGDAFTIADITAISGLDFVKLAKVRTPAEDYPHLARWRETVSARPAAALGL